MTGIVDRLTHGRVEADLADLPAGRPRLRLLIVGRSAPYRCRLVLEERGFGAEADTGGGFGFADAKRTHRFDLGSGGLSAFGALLAQAMAAEPRPAMTASGGWLDALEALSERIAPSPDCLWLGTAASRFRLLSVARLAPGARPPMPLLFEDRGFANYDAAARTLIRLRTGLVHSTAFLTDEQLPDLLRALEVAASYALRD